MYWIYIALFILILLTPKIVHNGTAFFREEDIEALLIFCFGTFGFLLYLAKEKALIRVFQEKMHLQKRATLITKDLSDSYSYIGEMNRKIDILKEVMFHLPKETSDLLDNGHLEAFQSILTAAQTLAKTDKVSLRFVDAIHKTTLKIYEPDHTVEFAVFEAPMMLASKKTFWEENGYCIVRSPLRVKGALAYIIFAKTNNHTDDIDVFKILASQALLLFSVDKYGSEEKDNEIISKKK
ncbi:MAG: hypothetical protein ACSLEX_01975 [Minisyncoccota bacterium]